MPFKAGKSPEDIGKKVKNRLLHISKTRTEAALTKVMYAVGGAADFYVPIDTGDLLQSRRVTVNGIPNGFRSTLSYGFNHTGAYAARLHEKSDWSPAQAGSPSKRGSGLNPNAKSNWIMRGVQDTDIHGIFKRAMAE